MARFGSVITAMVTPFAADGSLDIDGAKKLARWLVDNGNDGLVIAGTAGEGPTLEMSEQAELFAAVRESVSVPMIAGVGSNNTAESLQLTEAAMAAGADGLMIEVHPAPSEAHSDGAQAISLRTLQAILADARALAALDGRMLSECAADVAPL